MKRFTLLYLIFIFLIGCLPKVPKYPFRSPESLKKEAQQLSDNLEAYIRRWYKGEVPARLPARLLPKGYDYNRYKNIRLVKYGAINPQEVWVVRPAHKINFSKLYGSFPDPHATYLLAPVLYAPFGAKLHISGEYPYSRFFGIQVSPPFDPREYRYDKWAGKGEVSIVDADIVPLQGHTNPFTLGANRLANKRSYEVVYEMAMGDPTKLNPSHRPNHRGKGNFRYGGAIQVQGPWGLNKQSGHGRGVWDFGDVWIRYYAPDHDKFPLAGVDLPEMYFELKTGEKFFIVADLAGFKQLSESTMANRVKGNNNPASYNGPNEGWDKQFGIFLQIATGGSQALYKNKPSDKKYIRDLDLGVNGRGENQPSPASLEAHATGCNYINYLTTGMSIKKGKVFVITGKLPTFPDTRKGAKIMEKAQVRYWSITTYDAAFPFSKVKGLENTSIMDDEIALDQDRNYILVYSRPEDRPKNAIKANGVTWVNWGYTDTQAITLRWMAVAPEWTFESTPSEEKLPWAKSTWSGSQFDKSLLDQNNREGFLKAYHPVKHYLTKERFESLGSQFTIKDIPVWKDRKGNK